MSKRAKLSLDDTTENEEQLDVHNKSIKDDAPLPLSGSEKGIKSSAGEKAGLLKKTIYLGLTIASIVIFKRKLF